MSRLPRVLRHLAGVAAALLVSGSASGAFALPIEPQFAAPVVVMDRYELSAGDRVYLTIAGFTSRVVTVSVCGNRALRGSADCNMPASESVVMPADGSSLVFPFVVSPPPADCPCTVRVSSPGNDQVASAEFVLLNHPVAEPEGGSVPVAVLAASVEASSASTGSWGWLRSSLGGATTYDVRVRVRNNTTDVADGIVISGLVRVRGDASAAAIEQFEPGPIDAGATWDRTLQVTLPPPVFGTAIWRVDIAGAGPTLVVSDTTSHLPGSLIVLVGVLMIDLAWLGFRLLRRAWEGRGSTSDGDAAPQAEGSHGGDDRVFGDVDRDEVVPV